MKRLIVNSDDFGLTAGVNRAIVQLHRRNLLTSATLMAKAAATEEAIALAKAKPQSGVALGVGCHVVLVDGQPLVPAEKLPHLMQAGTYRFAPNLGNFLSRIFSSGKAIESEIEAEAYAQIALLQSRGVRLTHIDTHKHTHMFPRVLRPVLRAARAAGIRQVRNPFEPAWSRAATPGAPFARRAQVTLLHGLHAAFRRIVAEEGYSTTDGAVGVLATGTLDHQTVTALIAAIPDGTWELVTHPGYNDPDLARANTRLLASRETETRALEALQNAPGIELISFADLDPAAKP